eukprot:7382806-Prymnesium_polylepis.1
MEQVRDEHQCLRFQLGLADGVNHIRGMDCRIDDARVAIGPQVQLQADRREALERAHVHVPSPTKPDRLLFVHEFCDAVNRLVMRKNSTRLKPTNVLQKDGPSVETHRQATRHQPHEGD